MVLPSFQIIHSSFPVWEECLLFVTTSTVIWSFIARVIGGRLVFSLVMMPGVFLHELLHFLVGILTNARPSSFSILPDRVKAGSVSFRNITWYNAIPTALAPLLGLLSVSMLAASNLPTSIYGLASQNALIPLFLSPIAYACWPSSIDWKLSLYGWPVYLGTAAYWAYVSGWLPMM